MRMAARRSVKHFLVAVALAALSGLVLAALVGAALTGAIDGGARGPDVIELAARPVAFWFSVSIRLLVAMFAGGAAVAFWRKSVAA
ncbi:hypothetical protein PAGU2638_28990 [Lysobacter sp. PAGU 2638]